MRACELTDTDLAYISTVLKTNATLKVIDFSSNPGLTTAAFDGLCEVLTQNRVIEYFGLAKLGLQSMDVMPMLELFGRFPFPEDQVENQLAELKKRDAIIEKNKKLKAAKKPEEPVPQLDNIEQITRKNEEGEDIQEWVTIKNPQFKHLNLCMN